MSKVVKFYEPVLFDQQDEPQLFNHDFWTNALEKLGGLPTSDREYSRNGTTYCGEARVARSPAARYLYVGRLRPPADSPDNYRPGVGIVGPAATPEPEDQFSEPTIILPFGTNNYVAVMSPRHGSTRVETLSAWLSEVALNLDQKDTRFELVPIVDEGVANKLMSADGVTRLYVRIPPDAVVPASGGGELGNALRQAAQSAQPGMYVDVTWSYGHSKGESPGRHSLLTLARWVAKSGWTNRAEVSMQVEDEATGLRTEAHALFNDKITLQTTFEVEEGRVPSEETVLRALNQAIQEFRRRS